MADKVYVYALAVYTLYGQVLVSRESGRLPYKEVLAPMSDEEVTAWSSELTGLNPVANLKPVVSYSSKELEVKLYETTYPGSARLKIEDAYTWVTLDYIDPSVKAKALLAMEGGKLIK